MPCTERQSPTPTVTLFWWRHGDHVTIGGSYLDASLVDRDEHVIAAWRTPAGERFRLVVQRQPREEP